MKKLKSESYVEAKFKVLNWKDTSVDSSQNACFATWCIILDKSNLFMPHFPMCKMNMFMIVPIL